MQISKKETHQNIGASPSRSGSLKHRIPGKLQRDCEACVKIKDFHQRKILKKDNLIKYILEEINTKPKDRKYTLSL
jgi:hypothetical protein